MKSSAEQLYEAIGALSGAESSISVTSGEYTQQDGEFRQASNIALEISKKFEGHSNMLSNGWKTVSDFAYDIGNMVATSISGVAKEIGSYSQATINEEAALQAAATTANEASATLLNNLNNME